MGPGTRVSGRRTSSTDKAKSNGLMAQFTRANTWLARSTGGASTAGMTVPGIMASGKKTKSRALAPTPGWMADSTRESGSIIIWTESVCTPGRMVGSTGANTRMTRNTATVSILGVMAAHTPVTGAEASNTGLEPILCLASRPSLASGKKESELNGSTKFRLIRLCKANLTIRCTSERQRVALVSINLQHLMFQISSTTECKGLLKNSDKNLNRRLISHHSKSNTINNSNSDT